MDQLNWCRKDSSIIKEKHLFERFIVYGLAKIQRDQKYPIACAPEYSRITCYQRSISTYTAKKTFKSNYYNAFQL